MAKSGIERIDRLYYGHPAAQPLTENDSDTESICFLQDLLTGRGYASLPEITAPDYGMFTEGTKTAVIRFRKSVLKVPAPVTPVVDSRTLKKMIDRDVTSPIACRAYLTFKLNFAWNELLNILSLVTRFEGRFDTLNLNTDSAGLSFGVIQWAQSPGRLAEIVGAFNDAFNGKEKNQFNNVFGGSAAAQGMLAHVKKDKGGLRIIDAKTGKTDGETNDPNYDLIRSPWKENFKKAGRSKELQRIQVEIAQSDFRTSLKQIRAYVGGRIHTQRGLAFMLDLTNQHGPSLEKKNGKFKKGAPRIFQTVADANPDLSESELLEKMSERSVQILKATFKIKPEYSAKKNRYHQQIITQGTARRLFFRTPSFLLTDDELKENQ